MVPLVIFESLWRINMIGDSRDHAKAMEMLNRPLCPADGGMLELQTLLRSSADLRIRYELRPHLSGYFQGSRVVTDSRGFRVNVLDEKDRGEPSVHILGLGDSVMFGWGVDSSATYLSRLEEMLGRNFFAVSWDITNTAVPGYNIAMEIQTLKKKGLRLKPDVVIVGWVNNDLDLPHFLRPFPSVLRLDRFFSGEWLINRLSGKSRGKFEAPTIRIAGGQIEMVSAKYVSALPPDLRQLVGREAFDKSLRDLATAAKRHGFEAIMLVHRGRVARFLKDSCGAHGIPIVTARKLEKQFRKSKGLRRREDSTLTIGNRDPHPSVMGHELIATALRDHFTDSGLGQSLVDKAERRALANIGRGVRTEPSPERF